MFTALSGSMVCYTAYTTCLIKFTHGILLAGNILSRGLWWQKQVIGLCRCHLPALPPVLAPALIQAVWSEDGGGVVWQCVKELLLVMEPAQFSQLF